MIYWVVIANKTLARILYLTAGTRIKPYKTYLDLDHIANTFEIKKSTLILSPETNIELNVHISKNKSCCWVCPFH